MAGNKMTFKEWYEDTRPLMPENQNDLQFELREAWDLAVRAKDRLACRTCNEMREQIVETAQAKGFWSVWTTVFADDPEMVARLLSALPGTNTHCEYVLWE